MNLITLDNNIEKLDFSNSIETTLKKCVENKKEKDSNITICWDEISKKKFILLSKRGSD